MRNRVDLPQPLGPRMARNSPAAIERLTPCKTERGIGPRPNERATPEIVTDSAIPPPIDQVPARKENPPHSDMRWVALSQLDDRRRRRREPHLPAPSCRT